MKRICHMLLAAALLAAGCTKEDNGGPIDELVIGISNSESKVTHSEAKTQDSSAFCGPKVTKSL